MRGRSLRILTVAAVVLTAACVVLSPVLPAFAFDETGKTGKACGDCHQNGYDGKGPHGGYTATSKDCALCHRVHQGPATGILLLDSATVTGSCYTCHDGSGGQGVYGTLAARGLPVGARHSIDTTRLVPGGNGVTGESMVATFGGAAKNLGCDDCHAVHDAQTVNAFVGDRQRTADHDGTLPVTDKLLRRKPTGASVETAEYGSDWCGACHKGRLSGLGMPNNHPVESRVTTASPYYYRNVPILASKGPTSTTVVSWMGGLELIGGDPQTNAHGNRGFLMPVPRTSDQRGHNPLCQQCHEDSRNVGTLSADGATATAATATVDSLDGTPTTSASSDNPRFQDFPHETVNAHMVVEEGDDLCTNCHATLSLP